jgi:protocatechuate 3,4-dioxygenase beta subunit
MRAKRSKAQRWSKRLPRRNVLKGLGALAASAPAFSILACAADKSSASADALEHAGAGASTQPTAATAGSGGAAGSTAVNTSQPLAAGVGGASKPAGSGQAGAAGASKPSTGGSPAANGGGAGARAQAGAGGEAGAAGATGASGAGGTDGHGDSLIPPKFDDAASCTLTTTDIEGPFFIDDDEFPNDESLLRRDSREGLPGCEFQLSFRLLDAKQQCGPIAGAELYIWHCNAMGLYSGFNGQDPSKPYMGSADPTPDNNDRFCRAVQSTDADGIASFITLYPGWYAGRPLHLHLVARVHGATTRLITTQLYFPAAFTKEVHQSEAAYMARAANIPAGSLNPPSGKPAIPTLMHMPGLVIGTLNVIVNDM